MEAFQENFKRYEKKYMLKTEQYKKLREELNKRMEEDQYGFHTICNIYLFPCWDRGLTFPEPLPLGVSA